MKKNTSWLRPCLPEMRSGYIAGVPYAPNASINLFTYHDRMPMGIRNFVLDVNGQLLRRQWSDTAGDWNLFCTEPRDPYDVHASCGPFGVCSNTTSPVCQCPAGFAPRLEGEWRLGNMASGCERRQSQQQADCHTDGFLELPYAVQLPSGGFGSVYKGALPDATPVAVKTLHGWRQQGDKPFRAEVVTLGMIHHVNLVRLRGFCSEGSKRALMYDYMANGSLDSHLFITSSSSSKQRVLSWDQRFGIAVGVARGLAYLHEECRERIIHCDVKPENILLDEALWAKLADFGMAKLVGRDSSRVLTTVRGTPGYLAPEYLVSGRWNAAASSAAMYFPVHAEVRLRAGDVVSLLDERLSGDANLVQLERLCKVACWCIQDEERDRPTMGLVVQQLEGVADVGLPQIPSRLHMLTMLNGWVSGVAEDKLYFGEH